MRALKITAALAGILLLSGCHHWYHGGHYGHGGGGGYHGGGGYGRGYDRGYDRGYHRGHDGYRGGRHYRSE